MKTRRCRNCGALKCAGDKICSGCGAGQKTSMVIRKHQPICITKSHGFHEPLVKVAYA